MRLGRHLATMTDRWQAVKDVAARRWRWQNENCLPPESPHRLHPNFLIRRHAHTKQKASFCFPLALWHQSSAGFMVIQVFMQRSFKSNRTEIHTQFHSKTKSQRQEKKHLRGWKCWPLVVLQDLAPPSSTRSGIIAGKLSSYMIHWVQVSFYFYDGVFSLDLEHNKCMKDGPNKYNKKRQGGYSS